MDKGITWVETEATKGSGRTVKAHAVRTSVAKMKLTQEQEQAARDIEWGFYCRRAGFGYAMLGAKTANLTGTGGGGDSEGRIDSMRRAIKKLHEWEMHMFESGLDRNIMAVEAINLHGMTATEYAERAGYDRSTIVAWYKKGLDEWSEMYF